MASTTNSGSQRMTGTDAVVGAAVGRGAVCAGAWGVVVLGMVEANRLKAVVIARQGLEPMEVTSAPC